MKPERIDEGGSGHQRQAPGASAEMSAAVSVQAGKLDDWRGCESGEKPARMALTPNGSENQPGTDTASGDAIERGLLDDWIRNVEPDNPAGASDASHPAAGESTDSKTDDASKEEVIMRDGALRE